EVPKQYPQPAGTRPKFATKLVSMLTLDGPTWGGVFSMDAFLHSDVDYCSFVHYTPLHLGRAPRRRPRPSRVLAPAARVGRVSRRVPRWGAACEDGSAVQAGLHTLRRPLQSRGARGDRMEDEQHEG